MTYMLQGVAKAGLGSAATLFDQYAVAPYFGAELGQAVQAEDEATILNWAQSGSAGLDAAFHELQYGGTLHSDQSLAVVANWITKSGQVAAANGLQLSAYEGGISLGTIRFDTSVKATIQDFYNRLLADPRMGDLYTKLVNDFAAAGGDDFVAFKDTGTPGDSGSFGMLASIYSSGAPSYDALLAASGITGTGTSGSQAPQALINGTTGDDDLLATGSSEKIDGLAGNDKITGSSSTTDAAGHLIESDYYMGGTGNDTIVGGIGNDHIYGNELTAVAGTADGTDNLAGGAGNDYIQGNAGADTIDGGDGNDRLYGGADGDSMLGSAGNDYLQGNKGADILSGGEGNDVVHGGADNDRLNGDAGNDQLFGDGGDDTLAGGAGIDTLTGGLGNDVFVFSGHDAGFDMSSTIAWATDEITDFAHGSDKFQLDFHPAALLQGSASSASAALSFATEQLQAHAGQADVATVTVGNETYMFWDSTGHGGAIDSAVKLDGVQASTLTVADFL
jgi:serralysin